MLYGYNYASPLNQLRNLPGNHQPIERQTANCTEYAGGQRNQPQSTGQMLSENNRKSGFLGDGAAGNKSFTIAAILGLKGDAGAQDFLSSKKFKQMQPICKKSSKNKRVRTIFTPEQLERLEAEFERQQYMVGPERLYLAHALQLTEAQVKVWFQNRRIKWRKHHLEVTHQRLAVLKQRQLLLSDAQQDAMQENSNSSSTNS